MSRPRKLRGRNHTGSLVKRASGVYQARLCYQGHVYTFNTGERDRRLAKRAMDEWARSYQADSREEVAFRLKQRLEGESWAKERERASSRGIPLSELPSRWFSRMEASEVKASTRELYGRYFSSFLGWASKRGLRSMKDVSAESAREYLGAVASSMSERAWNYRVSFLRRVWREMGREGGCRSNPWEGFSARRVDRRWRRRMMSVEEVRRLFAGLGDDEERAMFALGAYCGLRVSDASQVRHGNVDFSAGVVRIRPQKVERTLARDLEIPMCGELGEVLRKVWREGAGPDEFLLPRMARAYRTKNMYRIVGRAFERAGIETSTFDERGCRRCVTGFHALRVFFASYAYRLGMSPYVIKSVLGHASVGMTEEYLRDTVEARRLKELPGLFGGHEVGATAAEMLEAAAREGETAEDVVRRLLQAEAKRGSFTVAS